MGITRAIVSGLIALSVALLPTVGAAVSVVEPIAMAMAADTSAGMSAEMPAAMDECCPHHGKPCAPAADQRQGMACCTYQFLTISSVAFLQFEYPTTRECVFPVPFDSGRSLHSDSPPFRPPRI